MIERVRINFYQIFFFFRWPKVGHEVSFDMENAWRLNRTAEDNIKIYSTASFETGFTNKLTQLIAFSKWSGHIVCENEGDECIFCKLVRILRYGCVPNDRCQIEKEKMASKWTVSSYSIRILRIAHAPYVTSIGTQWVSNLDFKYGTCTI